MPTSSSTGSHRPNGIRWSVRTIAAGLILALAGFTAVSAEESQGGCDEFTNALGTFHAFTGGACYQGRPNAVHGSWQNGYCGQYHCICTS